MANTISLSPIGAVPRFVWFPGATPISGGEAGSPQNDGVNDNLVNEFGPGVGRQAPVSNGVIGGSGPVAGVQKFALVFVPR